MKVLDFIKKSNLTNNVKLDFNKKYFFTYIADNISIDNFINLYDSNEEFRKLTQLAFLNAVTKVRSYVWNLLNSNYNNKIKIMLTLVANDLNFQLSNPIEVFDFETKKHFYIANIMINTSNVDYNYDDIKNFTFNDDVMALIESIVRSDNDKLDDNNIDF